MADRFSKACGSRAGADRTLDGALWFLRKTAKIGARRDPRPRFEWGNRMLIDQLSSFFRMPTAPRLSYDRKWRQFQKPL